MTDDKGLVNAYSSMYEQNEEPQQQDEAIVTGSILAAKAAMGALKGAKVAGALGKAAKVAGKVSQVADAAGAVGDAAHKIRGKGQHHPDSQQEEVEVNEGDTYAKQLARFEAGRRKRMKASGSYERPNWIPKDQDHKDEYGSSKGKKTTKEEVEGGVSVVDYNSDYKPTEIETVDIIPVPKMKGTEELKEDEAALESRLWDQVAANLTTLGEMSGVRYKVSPLEEKKDEEKKDEKRWQDDDGDDKWYEKSDVDGKISKREKDEKKSKKKDDKDEDKKEETKEGFNVKSPVTFSKKEEVIEDTTELTSKYASNILKADAILSEKSKVSVGPRLGEPRTKGSTAPNAGQGEKIAARTRAWMYDKGQTGSPGLDAMKARTAEHQARRGKKK